MWVGGLPADTREEEVRQEFGRHGQLANVRLLPRPRAPHIQSAACFVDFADKVAAGKCKRALNMVRGQAAVCNYNMKYKTSGDTYTDDEGMDDTRPGEE